MKNKITLLLTALTALAVCACTDNSKKTKAFVPDDVYVANPLIKQIDVWDEYTARIDSIKYVEIRARVNGYLDKINFSEGQLVKQGDILMLIDPRPYQAAVDAAKAGVKEVEARLALAESNLKRAKSMYDATVVSKEVYETRDAEVLTARAALLNANARLREALLNLEYTRIIAPVSGRVGEALIDEGNLVSANATLLTSIVKSDIMQAYFELSERDIVNYDKLGLFKKIDQKNLTGPEVELRLSADSGEVFKGKVTYFDNKMGRTTSSLTMRADIINNDFHLTAGMFAKLRLNVAQGKDTMLVREDVIGTDLVSRYVMTVDKDNKVVYKPVTVGRLLGKMREIESGLGKDDRVVVNSLHNAVPNRIVNPISSKMDAQ